MGLKYTFCLGLLETKCKLLIVYDILSCMCIYVRDHCPRFQDKMITKLTDFAFGCVERQNYYVPQIIDPEPDAHKTFQNTARSFDGLGFTLMLETQNRKSWKCNRGNFSAAPGRNFKTEQTFFGPIGPFHVKLHVKECN